MQVTSTEAQNQAAEDLMQRTLAQIAAEFDHEPARMRERMRHDKRMQGLEALILSLAAPKPADGYQGGLQIMLEMTSSEHWRQMRAKALRSAREHQIMGCPGAARMWLRKAAWLRLTEVTYRNLEAVDRACDAMAADRLVA